MYHNWSSWTKKIVDDKLYVIKLSLLGTVIKWQTLETNC